MKVNFWESHIYHPWTKASIDCIKTNDVNAQNLITARILSHKTAHLTDAATGPGDDDKLWPRTIPEEDPGSEEFTPDVGSIDGTKPWFGNVIPPGWELWYPRAGTSGFISSASQRSSGLHPGFKHKLNTCAKQTNQVYQNSKITRKTQLQLDEHSR